MKRISTYFIFLVTLIFTSCIGTQQIDSQNYSADSDGITYQQFYDDLSPYGNWVDYQNYGYVWVPEEAGFRPYYNNGHWIYTNYGWTWASDYNWGWAPFHYGRWLYDNDYGWMWVPGYEWAPAWVSWRNSPDYYGWAPLGPGVNFNVTNGQQMPYNYWAFVPHRYINSSRINNYYVDRSKNITIINNTTIINNVRVTGRKTEYITGPSVTDVERTTNQKIREVKLVNRTSPGNTRVTGNALSIYKPPVKENQPASTVRPPKVTDLNILKARHMNFENGQTQSSPVTEQRLPPTLVEKPTSQTPLNQQKLPENKIEENTNVTPPQQNQVPEETPQKTLPQRIFRPEKENIVPDNNESGNKQKPFTEPTIKNNQPVIKNNAPVKVNSNKPPLKLQRNFQPAQRKFNNPSSNPVNSQPEKVQQRNIQQPRKIFQAPRQQPVREMPVIKNQNPLPQPPIKREDVQKK